MAGRSEKEREDELLEVPGSEESEIARSVFALLFRLQAFDSSRALSPFGSINAPGEIV